MSKKELSPTEQKELLDVLKERFEKNMKRHHHHDWETIEAALTSHPTTVWSISQMELTGGEPDVVAFDPKAKEIYFVDCSAESPSKRRSLCYDQESLDSRKENKPENSAVGMAEEMGIQLLTEDEYRHLQTLGTFDLKTSSWIQTPDPIRKLDGALFADRRYDTVFVYHNSAPSYYASRGFRGLLKM
ncbi:DUF4256 domain-containing protein [candidate division WWE3 bacterium]|nr:DUF4256 domain-containing protein [candidate division WWE3 bacterium]